MAMEEARLRRLNDALLSVYYYGRRGSPALSGTTPRDIPIMSLEDAVDTLTADPPEPETLRPMRLAILDLCRTRTGGPPADIQLVDVLILRLARRIAERTQVAPDQLAAQFGTLFQMHAMMTPDDAYVRAMNLLAPAYDSGNRESVQLVSWEDGV
jgi:hypothetical protein